MGLHLRFGAQTLEDFQLFASDPVEVKSTGSKHVLHPVSSFESNFLFRSFCSSGLGDLLDLSQGILSRQSDDLEAPPCMFGHGKECQGHGSPNLARPLHQPRVLSLDPKGLEIKAVPTGIPGHNRYIVFIDNVYYI